MGANGEQGEHEKGGKYQPDDLKHSICDPKHSFWQPKDSKHFILWSRIS